MISLFLKQLNVRKEAVVKTDSTIEHVCRLTSTESCKAGNKKEQKRWEKKGEDEILSKRRRKYECC